MTDDVDVVASEPATCTFTPAELSVHKSGIEDLERCSRPIWAGADASRCVWHAEGIDKPPDELPATIEDGKLSGARVRESDLTRDSFPYIHIFATRSPMIFATIIQHDRFDLY